MSESGRRRIEGSVIEYDRDGGYGFLISGELGYDKWVFFHVTDIEKEYAEEGYVFEFSVEQTEKGPRATNLTKIDERPPQSTKATSNKHKPGVTGNTSEEVVNQFALEQKQKSMESDEDDDDDDEETDPFSDDVRGSKNDLL